MLERMWSPDIRSSWLFVEADVPGRMAGCPDQFEGEIAGLEQLSALCSEIRLELGDEAYGIEPRSMSGRSSADADGCTRRPCGQSSSGVK
jgi:hypothetical protein